MITLERRATAFGTITILRRKSTGTVIYEQNGNHQSEADFRGISLASYVHALYDALLQAEARSVLMIGCGGGTLATMLSRAGRRVTMIDINPDAFALARRYFCLPSDVECHCDDGRTYLLSHAGKFDAIVLDAYDGDRAPEHLQRMSFHRIASARLNPAGVFLANVHLRDDQDETADFVAQHAAAAWRHVRLLDALGYNDRNAVLAAGNVESLRLPSPKISPATGGSTVAEELSQMRFRPWRARSESTN